MTQPPYYPSQPSGSVAATPPPRLHWGLILLIGFLTGGIFFCVWMLIQANWVKKTTGDAKPFNLAAAATGVDLFYLVCIYGLHSGALGSLLGLALMIVYIMASLSLRTALQNILGKPLSGALSILLSCLYFQSQLAQWGSGAAIGGYGAPQQGNWNAAAQQQQGNWAGSPQGGQWAQPQPPAAGQWAQPPAAAPANWPQTAPQNNWPAGAPQPVNGQGWPPQGQQPQPPPSGQGWPQQ